MNLLAIVAIAAVVLTVAYFTYGRLLTRLLQLDAARATPAVELRDDLDYDPIDSKFLLSQHFSAIAAAGPIVGPILAGLMFGWVPALLWILIGSILIGGVHDMTALTASIRHKARSIAEVVRQHMSQRSFLLFLAFIWIALVYIIVAFTDVTASAFVGGDELVRRGTATAMAADPSAVTAETIGESGGVTGGAIATSSILYLVLPIVMGLLLRYTRLSLGWATLIFVPLVGVVIWVGQYFPFDLGLILQRLHPTMDLSAADQAAQKWWDVALLAYCLIAGVVPVWLLLQPRGHLGGYFLYAALMAGFIGVVLGGFEIQYDAFKGWGATGGKGETLLPFLFITIACGACSGFHSLIASGTTSKQLKFETDARPVGYGAMLLEAMVATFALASVMILSNDSALTKQSPNQIYASGLGEFLGTLGIAKGFAIAFGLMAFTTFVYDTLDVCTRLGRYIIQELTGLQNWIGRWLGTALTAGVPLYFLLNPPIDASGKAVPAWKTFWFLFGASNQLLAALSLLGVTVWLWRTRRAGWVWFVTGIPTVVMYTMSTWALVAMTWPKFLNGDGEFSAPSDPVPWAGLILILLALLMLIEAVLAIAQSKAPPAAGTQPKLVPAT
ncbi:MAG: carbon starvation protein A [Pirellulales bacterium]|nr:carbon starvation protein A [Pirellulales bacterium]